MSGMNSLLDGLHLHTICESAHCPNMGDCFSRQTATFLILGDTCTRNCTFCAVNKGVPQLIEDSEPGHIAQAIAHLGLKHVVITSVTRDDLPDGGAEHFARIIKTLRNQSTDITIEVLIPDFKGSRPAIESVVETRPDVINHNIETVPSLYPAVRPMADFQRSLDVLRMVKEMDAGIITKSGLMLGLGETREEIIEAMHSLRDAACDLLTIGQYLQPSFSHHAVIRYVTPQEFEEFAIIGRAIGFREVASAPLVRSSFNAAHLYQQSIAKG